MHTVFSDGSVWPDIRVIEAWQEGLDALVISDHIEYLPHKSDMIINHNRPFEIAQPIAKNYGMILIRGAELTRSNPPGHLNAVFITDVTEMDTSDYTVALMKAKEQGGFIFMNHPFWKSPKYPVVNGKVDWFKEHEELYKLGLINGIEIVNDREYYKEGYRWAIEKNLVKMGNSDIHHPTNMYFDFSKDDHRAMTLVFAKEKTLESIKEALFENRTVVYYSDKLLGDEKFLREIFNKSITISKKFYKQSKGTKFFIQVENNSDVTYTLLTSGKVEGFNLPSEVILHKNRTIMMELTPQSKEMVGIFKVKLPFIVSNLLINHEDTLPVEFEIEVELE
jgi:hypothetical protein